MSKHLEEQLDYDNVLLDLFHSCKEYGCRNVLIDFRQAFPDMFEELLIQGNRLKPEKPIAALLR